MNNEKSQENEVKKDTYETALDKLAFGSEQMICHV